MSGLGLGVELIAFGFGVVRSQSRQYPLQSTSSEAFRAMLVVPVAEELLGSTP